MAEARLCRSYKPEVFVGASWAVCLCSSLPRWLSRLSVALLSRYQRRSRTVQREASILFGTDEPNYGRTVDIVTRAALKEMVIPGIS